MNDGKRKLEVRNDLDIRLEAVHRRVDRLREANEELSNRLKALRRLVVELAVEARRRENVGTNPAKARTEIEAALGEW